MVDDRFYDTTIICSNGYIKTNKCFLVLSDRILSCILCDLSSNRLEVILMNDYKTEEVFSLTRKFSKIFKASGKLEFQPLQGRQETGFEIQKKLYNQQEKTKDSKIVSGSECFVEKLAIFKSNKGSLIDENEGRSESSLCSDCGKIFSSSKKMRNHKYNVHPKITDRYECDQCPKKFPYVHTLNKHKLISHSRERFRCSICSKSFGLRCNLLKHIRIFH